MKNKLHVIGIQADLIWENPKQNLHFFEEKIKTLPETTDLIVLPEMFTSGFTMNAKKVAEKMDGKTISWMLRMAKKYNVAITGSLVITENNKFYNRLIFVFPSGEITRYDKRHSFTLAGEDKAYTSGTKRVVINYKGWKICPLICYDLRFPVWARNTENYDLLLYMANWPVTRINAWKTLLKARAIENMSYVIGVNRIGTDANDYQYSGDSLISDYLGNELASLPTNVNGILAANLSIENLQKCRNKLGFLNDKDHFKILV